MSLELRKLVRWQLEDQLKLLEKQKTTPVVKMSSGGCQVATLKGPDSSTTNTNTNTGSNLEGGASNHTSDKQAQPSNRPTYAEILSQVQDLTSSDRTPPPSSKENTPPAHDQQPNTAPLPATPFSHTTSPQQQQQSPRQVLEKMLAAVKKNVRAQQDCRSLWRRKKLVYQLPQLETEAERAQRLMLLDRDVIEWMKADPPPRSWGDEDDAEGKSPLRKGYTPDELAKEEEVGGDETLWWGDERAVENEMVWWEDEKEGDDEEEHDEDEEEEDRNKPNLATAATVADNSMLWREDEYSLLCSNRIQCRRSIAIYCL